MSNPTVSPVRIAVIGLGVMGMNHVRTLAEMPQFDLVAVSDRRADRTELVAREYGCKAVDSPEELAGLVDCAVIAVISTHHAEVAIPLLEAGVSCLVEKPLAPDRAGCEAMIAAASASGAHLLVGHIERFNPAVMALEGLVDEIGEIRNLSAERLGINTGRVTDIDVILDLMVHDLSVFQRLLPTASLRGVNASTPGINGHAGPEQVSALIAFDNGVTATVVANRQANTRKRTLEIFTDRAFVELDYIARTITMRRLAAAPAEFEDRVVRVGELQPLEAELDHFGDVVAGRATALLGADDAMTVMDWAWGVQKAVNAAQMPG